MHIHESEMNTGIGGQDQLSVSTTKKKNQMVTEFWRWRREDGDAAVMTFQQSV